MFINQKIAKFLFFLFCLSIFSSISQTNEDVPLNNIAINEIPKPISSLIFEDFLGNQIESVLLFAIFIPISAVLADRYGRKLILIMASLGIILFGIVLGPLLDTSLLLTLSIGMALMGFTYGPLGTILSELYPTNVRYTGSSLSFNFAGIVGASFAPFIALWLSSNFGVHYVGYYLALAAIISLIATYLSSKAK